MPTATAILGDPEIEKFIEKHQDAAEPIRRAVRQLGAKRDGLAAVKKLLPALSQDKIFVFFSYNNKDEEAATEVVQALRSQAANKLQITYQAEFTERIAGKKWRDEIREAIRPANWFVLLLPDPSDERDWCLFETGLFVANRCSADSLICLHHPDTRIPSQIGDYHAVSATLPEVEKFLRMVYVRKDPVPGMPPINPDIEDLPQVAKRIVDAIRPPKNLSVRETFEPWVQLKLDRAAELQSEEDLDAAVVVEVNQAALDLFGFLRPQETWRELRSAVREEANDGRWRIELFHVLRRIARGRKFHPIQAVFKTDNGKMYRPVACAVDRLGENGPIDTFHVTFAEDVSALDAEAMPKDVSFLADVLRFTFRFRWEVLEKFSKGPLTDDDVDRLENTLRRIMKDWESRHVGDESEIFGLFDGDNRRRFVEMSVAWKKIKNEEGTGELDLAIADRDTEKIPGLLAQFLPMNQEFLEIAAERFSELVSGKPRHVPPPPPAGGEVSLHH